MLHLPVSTTSRGMSRITVEQRFSRTRDRVREMTERQELTAAVDLALILQLGLSHQELTLLGEGRARYRCSGVTHHNGPPLHSLGARACEGLRVEGRTILGLAG